MFDLIKIHNQIKKIPRQKKNKHVQFFDLIKKWSEQKVRICCNLYKAYQIKLSKTCGNFVQYNKCLSSKSSRQKCNVKLIKTWISFKLKKYIQVCYQTKKNKAKKYVNFNCTNCHKKSLSSNKKRSRKKHTSICVPSNKNLSFCSVW